MRPLEKIATSLVLILGLGQVQAQEVVSSASGRTGLPVTLGRPEPLIGTPLGEPQPTASPQNRVGLRAPEPLVRGQGPDAPPPPPPVSPFGSAAGPPPAAGPGPGFAGPSYGKEEAYSCGVVNSNADTGNFWSRCCGKVKRCCEDVTDSFNGIFQPGGNRSMFQSDCSFNFLSSPVSNPFYFEDPRALSELRPIFIWQRTRDSNPVFAGGDNFFAGLQARVAFTERVSLVFHKLGWIWMEPHNPSGNPEFSNHTGLTELHLGPKVTFIHNTDTNTIAALGLAFEVPIGPRKVFQNTGNLSLRPYLSFGQNFGKSNYGSFNFLNTTGYAFGVDNERTDSFFSSFHLDYNVLGQDRFFPLIELNWAHYTSNGGVRSLGFEGRDLFNFGSDGVAGHDELTLAIGGRVKINNFWQIGLVGEMGLIGGGRHLDDFRITADMIFRY
jgi:hypothetical protein